MMPTEHAYYDVESGTWKDFTHGSECLCPTCSRARLRSALSDIITKTRAYAPRPKRSSKSKGFFTGRRFGRELGDDIDIGEPVIEGEGSCFGWNLDGPLAQEVDMIISSTPPHPDMTKGEMATMSVDQSRAVITLKALYNPFFIERLKVTIEPKYRNWNKDNKCWEIHPSKMKDVQAICQQYYKGVQII